MPQDKQPEDKTRPKQVHRLVKNKTPEDVVRQMMQTKPGGEGQSIKSREGGC